MGTVRQTWIMQRLQSVPLGNSGLWIAAMSEAYQGLSHYSAVSPESALRGICERSDSALCWQTANMRAANL